jgi:MYXO-CTERM domain-containing protein
MGSSSIRRTSLYVVVASACVLVSGASLVPSKAGAQALTYSLAGGNEDWPDWARDAVTQSMDEATALYNGCGHFEKSVTANYNSGVPTAQANYDGWIDFGGSYNTRVALHEIAHTLGVGTIGGFDGGARSEESAAGRLVKVYDGQAAVINTGGTHFWPYGLNYDDEDGPAARERHCRIVAALRFDMGIVQDSDADGLRDDWETFHFGSLDADGASDADADGILDVDELAVDSDPNDPVPVMDGGTYVLRSQISERMLAVVGDSVDDGALTEQREGDAQPNAQWIAEYLGKGYFRFTNVQSGMVLEVEGTDTAPGRPIRQATWTEALSQQWRITTGPGADEGYYLIANRETGGVVDSSDGAEGTAVHQWPFVGGVPQQFWRFETIALPPGSEDGGIAADGGAQQPEPDAGTGEPAADAGVPGPAPTADAGMPGSDVDAAPIGPAETETPPKSSSGCAVSTQGAPTSALPWIAAALALLRYRRKRPQP